MPSLQDTVGQDLSGYVPVKASPQASLPPTQGLEPTINTMIRCPLPPIFQASPDSLRQFYQGGKVPQTRLLSPVTQGISGGGGGGGNAVVTTAVIQGSGSNPPPTPVVQKQAVITTTVLGPGQQFITTLTSISRSFQLLNVTSSVAARIEIYGTAASQLADSSRPLDTAPPAGTAQGIITDVAIDSAPFIWDYQNRIGANGEIPQQPQAYVTITNISGAAVPVTITIQYVPIEA